MAMLPRSSLSSFLTSARSALRSAIINQQCVSLVIGNESCDLDSITSAITLAYLKSSTPLNSPGADSVRNRQQLPNQHLPLYVPVLNITSRDISIRPELLALLPHAGLNQEHLITLDDLRVDPSVGLSTNNPWSLQPRLTRLVLTDHNKLAGQLSPVFDACVVGCIDHHIDEGIVPTSESNEPRIIETTGSCTSLVVRCYQNSWDSLSSRADNSSSGSAQDDATVGMDDAIVRRKWNAQVAKLAIASILIDTNNLQNEDKTTDHDIKACKYLEAMITTSDVSWERSTFFKQIKSAKNDLDGFSVNDLLRKDYKQWSVDGKELGVSSIGKQIQWQVETPAKDDKHKFLDELRDFAKERNLDVMCIMTTSASREGTFQRELLLWSLKSENEFVEKFEKEYGQELQLEPWQELEESDGFSQGGMEKLKIWWQRATTNSRKQVAPMLRECLQK